jgi:hypothetical protein
MTAPPRSGHQDATAGLAITNEKQLLRLVTDMAEHLGWRTYHTFNAMRSNRGFPDLVCAHIHHGVLFLELKVNAPVTPDQVTWISLLNMAGHRAYVGRPRDTVEGG